MPIHPTASELDALWATSHEVINREFAPSYQAFIFGLHHEHVSAPGGNLDGKAFVVDRDGLHLATVPARNYSRNAVVVTLAPPCRERNRGNQGLWRHPHAASPSPPNRAGYA